MRLIDADVLSEKVEALMNRYAAQGRKTVAEDYKFVITVLDTAPTINPDDLRPQGWWVFEYWDSEYINRHYSCSECGFESCVKESCCTTKYCSNCGAKMDGKENE